MSNLNLWFLFLQLKNRVCTPEWEQAAEPSSHSRQKKHPPVQRAPPVSALILFITRFWKASEFLTFVLGSGCCSMFIQGMVTEKEVNSGIKSKLEKQNKGFNEELTIAVVTGQLLQMAL